MQADGWSDDELAKLQHEWEGVDFFKNLPEMAAFKRAGSVDACVQQRKGSLGGLTLSELFKDIVDSPKEAPAIARGYWVEFRYRTQGTYDDEKALLLFFRDREVEMKKAMQATSWAQMLPMPGVTNNALFVSKYRGSRVQSLLNLRSVGSTFQSLGSSFLGRAALAETQRRLMLAAIALERVKIHHGHYPTNLRELTRNFNQSATDFMDGQPLRYHLGDDGRFVLYSTGLDCVDNGGQLSRRASQNRFNPRIRTVSRPARAEDLVWPCAANSKEVAGIARARVEGTSARGRAAGERESEYYWERTAKRQASVEKTLASSPVGVRDVRYNGQSLVELLRNPKVSGTNPITLGEMLTLRPIITGAEPETITFEAPINSESLTNVGIPLVLYIDSVENDDSDEGSGVGVMECSPATNGNCLVTWHTIFETPGKHALLMGFGTHEPPRTQAGMIGPAFTAVVTNLCQFSISSATFDPTLGARFLAHLPELKGDYSIEILTLKGDRRLRTISGSTSNGVINEFWDLIGDDQSEVERRILQHGFPHYSAGVRPLANIAGAVITSPRRALS